MLEVRHRFPAGTRILPPGLHLLGHADNFASVTDPCPFSSPVSEPVVERNLRAFTWFRVFFTARFYYPVYALVFLDYGLTLAQFGILNAVWALSIVLLEVPSGALADTLGRRTLLIAAGIFMIVEMAVLLVAPIGGGALLFGLFLLNRVFSGAAEAAASGADEALAYDSLKANGQESRWGHVLERVQRDTSLAFFFAMMIGAAVYDPQMVNNFLNLVGSPLHVTRMDLVKIPIFLTFLSALMVLFMALRMKEPPVARQPSLKATFELSWSKTLVARKWVWNTPLAFAVILAAMAVDSVIRQFLTLASEYWRIIEYPIASFGLIGSGMALLGLFVPRIARMLSESGSPLRNFLVTAVVVAVGLYGLGLAIPIWGIIPAILLYAAIQLTGFFVSRYLNEAAPSEQRATVLSLRGLATNLSYGTVALLYAGLIVVIRAGVAETEVGTVAADNAIFVESLFWFAPFFIFLVGFVFIVYRSRFRASGEASS